MHRRAFLKLIGAVAAVPAAAVGLFKGRSANAREWDSFVDYAVKNGPEETKYLYDANPLPPAGVQWMRLSKVLRGWNCDMRYGWLERDPVIDWLRMWTPKSNDAERPGVEFDLDRRTARFT